MLNGSGKLPVLVAQISPISSACFLMSLIYTAANTSFWLFLRSTCTCSRFPVVGLPRGSGDPAEKPPSELCAQQLLPSG